MSKYRKQSEDASAHNHPWAGFGDRQRAAAKKRRGRQTERSGFTFGRRNPRPSHSAPYASTAAAGFLNFIGDLWHSTEAGRAAHAGHERRGRPF
jgi:hypothetical protein